MIGISFHRLAFTVITIRYEQFQFFYKQFHFKSIMILVCRLLHQASQTFSKVHHFRTKSVLENQIPLICSIISLAIQPKFYVDSVNSWLVIYDSRRIQHQYKHEQHNQRKNYREVYLLSKNGWNRTQRCLLWFAYNLFVVSSCCSSSIIASRKPQVALQKPCESCSEPSLSVKDIAIYLV